MTADSLYKLFLGMMVFFIALWVLLLGIGFLLSLRDDLVLPEECPPAPDRHSMAR